MKTVRVRLMSITTTRTYTNTARKLYNIIPSRCTRCTLIVHGIAVTDMSSHHTYRVHAAEGRFLNSLIISSFRNQDEWATTTLWLWHCIIIYRDQHPWRRSFPWNHNVIFFSRFIILPLHSLIFPLVVNYLKTKVEYFLLTSREMVHVITSSDIRDHQETSRTPTVRRHIKSSLSADISSFKF